MPTSNKNKKVEKAKQLRAAPCSAADIEGYKTRYDKELISIFIHEVWFVNGIFHLKNIYANKAACAALGYTAEEFCGMNKQFRKKMFHENDMEQVERTFHNLHLPENAGKTKPYNLNIRNKNGDYLFGNNISSLIKPAKSREHGLILNYFHPYNKEQFDDVRIRIIQAESLFNSKLQKFDMLNYNCKRIIYFASRGCTSEEIGQKINMATNSVEQCRSRMSTILELGEMSFQCFVCRIAPCVPEKWGEQKDRDEKGKMINKKKLIDN